MTIYHVEGGELLMLVGPAKADIVADIAPYVAASAVPTVSALTPNTAASLVGVDLTMTVTGTGFNQLSRIVFNGNDEPTNYISPTSLSTIVKPSMFAVPAVVPVGVRNGSTMSNTQNFTFT
jgi:hypothetical protein